MQIFQFIIAGIAGLVIGIILCLCIPFFHEKIVSAGEEVKYMAELAGSSDFIEVMEGIAQGADEYNFWQQLEAAKIYKNSLLSIESHDIDAAKKTLSEPLALFYATWQDEEQKGVNEEIDELIKTIKRDSKTSPIIRNILKRSNKIRESMKDDF